MDDVIYSPHILKLSGVSLKNCKTLDEFFEDKLLNDERIIDESPNDEISMLDMIPSNFTSLDEYPKYTNLKCWSCSLNFNTIPIFVPTFIQTTSDNINIGIRGNMCSFNCASLWIDTMSINLEEKWNLHQNLCLLFFIMTGKFISYIKPAFCKTKLKAYGGEWDEKTFVQEMKKINPYDDTYSEINSEERIKTLYNIINKNSLIIKTENSLWKI